MHADVLARPKCDANAYLLTSTAISIAGPCIPEALMTQQLVFMYGNGGHARVILDSITAIGMSVAAYIDEISTVRDGDQCNGVPIFRSWDAAATALGDQIPTVLAIGDNAARHKIASHLIEANRPLQTVCHPSAVISSHSTVGIGTVVGPNAVINSGTTIGSACIVNSCACVEHDCTLGDAVHIGPAAALCGWCTIGDRTFVGGRAVLRDRISVGSDVVVGLGSVVVSNVPNSITVAGCPARRMRDKVIGVAGHA